MVGNREHDEEFKKEFEKMHMYKKESVQSMESDYIFEHKDMMITQIMILQQWNKLMNTLEISKNFINISMKQRHCIPNVKNSSPTYYDYLISTKYKQ